MPSHTQPSPPIHIFGEVLFDHFPDGARVLGGAPFNVAWHLQAFGAAPRLVSAVGDDADGRAIRAAMLDWGLDDSGLQTAPGRGTGRVEIRLRGGEPSYDILPDRAYDHIRPPAGHTMPDLLYHGTLALRQTVSAATLAGLRAAAGTVFLDVNLRPPWWSREQVLNWVAAADWVKLNAQELAWLESAELPAGAELEPRVRDFLQRHQLAGLVVTLGRDGAVAMTPEDPDPVRVAPPPATRVVDTVGAGDAFAAVLLLGIRHGWTLAQMLERAQSFASRIVARRGATAADRALYAPFVASWGLPGDAGRPAADEF